MASYRLEPEAQAALDAHLAWLERHSRNAAARFAGALEVTLRLLASGTADGPPVTLADGRQVRRWRVRPMLLFYERRGGTVVVVRARHEAQRPLTG